MTIQRYKWPMIVAAGLHGALFLITPEPSTAHPVADKPLVLPPIPDDEKIVQMTDPAETTSEASAGGPVLPMIQEEVVTLPDKFVFTTPKTENPNTDRLIPTETRSILPSGGGSGGPRIEGGTIFDPTSLDRHPRATAQISPEYPLSLHQQGIGGSVTVEFDVDTLGRVVRAEVVSCTRREFAEPALRAVRNWRFEPGKRHGKAVPFRMTVPIQFTIDS